MKGMIFAAGLGTRLKPLTDTLPKALVPVGGKPLLEHVLKKFSNAGIGDVVVNVHHFSDKVEEWIAGQDWISCTDTSDGDVKVSISDESDALLDTGGAVLHARRYLEGCGRFLIHNVDILSDCDFMWFASQADEDSLATLLVSERKSSRYLLFEPDTMKLRGWMNEKTGETRLCEPGTDPDRYLRLAFSGIHIMSEKVFDVMEEYAREHGLYECSQTPRFPVIDFYLDKCGKYDIRGVRASDLNLVDVGKLDTLAKADEFCGISG